MLNVLGCPECCNEGAPQGRQVCFAYGWMHSLRRNSGCGGAVRACALSAGDGFTAHRVPC